MAFYEFEIRGNEFLKNDTIGYYSIDFLSYRQSGELSFLHKLKNNWLKNSDDDLFKSKDEAVSKIYNFLMDLNNYSMECHQDYWFAFYGDYYPTDDFYCAPNQYGEIECTTLYSRSRISFAEENVLVCRIPRSKINLQDSQLLFQLAIREAIELVNDEWSLNTNYKLIDGIDCIKRIKAVPTTHLTGDRAYPGITQDSCFISDEVQGRTILLIDDIYTLGVGVVEDCIQALYDKGAKKVIFYAVGRTVKKRNTPSRELNEYNIDRLNGDDEIPF